MVDALKSIRAAGNPVALVSNRSEPSWFQQAFSGTQVQFLKAIGRQNGELISQNAQRLSMRPFDVLVLATKAEDVAMGKNGGALLLGAAWSQDRKVQSLGVQIENAADLLRVVQLTKNWSGQWYFAADTPDYCVRALSDLSTKKFGLAAPQQQFAHALTSTVKSGSSKLKALLAVTARSLLMEGITERGQLLFGTYPSSASSNNDTEVLSDFVHRLRTTVSQVRMASRGQPLFIRHMPSSKRSTGGGNRMDPSEQLRTIHVNPYYRDNGRINGKYVVVVDDCTTYGASFGVAAALLRAAGAAGVIGVALGKFGNQAHHFRIKVTGNPFAPLGEGDFRLGEPRLLNGSVNAAAQLSLQQVVS
ncbi:hypothetical protein [Bordetella trematum]|uniref:hypothetical protein n=1 Tax=Bordetella trematum TaxID=123899 RepID=UPI000F637224|nr:hypothetical protein [Bordetella trematum]